MDETIDWGRTRYEDAWRRQEELVHRRIAGEIGDVLVFTEHEPVFTLGLRRGAEDHLVWDERRREAAGVELIRSNRGGDVTYHGPGQIVGYPIVSLESRRDLHAYLRFLEQVVIGTLAEFGLAAARREGKTGIWIESRKIAAIGVAVRRWVTYHGFALNVAPDLTPFDGIIPCGIAASEGTVTSLARELRPPPPLDAVKVALAATFWKSLKEFRTPTSPEAAGDYPPSTHSHAVSLPLGASGSGRAE